MTQALLEKENTALHEDDATQFLQEIRGYPLLTPAQELEVAKQCAQGDADAIRTMVNCNLRLVVAIAREYAGRGVPLLDLIQEGSIGLLSAAKNFDHTQQCRFSTYAAKWIRQGVNRCVLNHAGMIRVPRQTLEKMRKLLAIKSAIKQETGAEPTPEQLAQASGIPQDRVSQLLEQMPQVYSLDSPSNEDATLQTLLENTQTPQPYEALIRRELKQNLENMLGMLNARQQQILRLHFGMDDGTCYSLQQIAELLGISKERTRQIERQAMDKLQRLGASLGLEDFLD